MGMEAPRAQGLAMGMEAPQAQYKGYGWDGSVPSSGAGSADLPRMGGIDPSSRQDKTRMGWASIPHRGRVSGDTRDGVLKGSGGRVWGRWGRVWMGGASKRTKILRANVDRRGSAITNRGHTRGQAGPTKGADPLDIQRRG